MSLSYILFASKQLTRPVFQLYQMIRDTSLETLGDPVEIPDSSDEFRDLGKAYADMRERLNEAVIRETNISVLQLQAQFDLLQAQVNPHFIYNVLNIISARGIKDGDEMICDICGDLAWMLRYATNTREKFATIAQEISHLDKYFALLKYRYEQKLNCTVRIKKELHSAYQEEFLERFSLDGLRRSMELGLQKEEFLCQQKRPRPTWFFLGNTNNNKKKKPFFRILSTKDKQG